MESLCNETVKFKIIFHLIWSSPDDTLGVSKAHLSWSSLTSVFQTFLGQVRLQCFQRHHLKTRLLTLLICVFPLQAFEWKSHKHVWQY